MFAQESVMDIQKEREAFEKECRLLCYKGNMVMSNLGSFYNNEQTNWMWQMWLSAKAQAVPEGFLLVGSKDLLDLTVAINALDLATHTESKTNEVREMWQDIALKLMALGEAQEQSHEH